MENFVEQKSDEKGIFLSNLLTSNYSVNSLIVNEGPQMQIESSERSGTKQICRLCANVVDKAVNLFVNMDNGESLVDKINSCLPVTIKQNDALPKQLCTSCIEKLHECFQFSVNSISAEQKLMNQNSTTSTFNCPNVNNNTIDTRICNMNYRCPLCVEGTLWLVNNQNSESENYREADKSTFKNNFTVPSICTELNVEHEREIDMKNEIESEEEKFFTELNVTANPENEDIIHVLNNVNLSCKICNKLFHTAEILNHCKFHAACNFFPCVLCDNIYFVNEAQIEIHLSNHHNMVSCNVNSKEQIQEINSQCDFILKNNILPNENFETGTVLNLEEHENPSSVDFKICNDVEEEVMLYNSLSLSESSKNCEICGEQFSSDALMTLHMNSEHSLDSILRCTDCQKNFESPKYLEEHIQNEHISGKAYQYEYCDINFNEQTQIKKNSKYFNLENSSDPQVCYFCSECKAVFPDLNQISEHGSIHQEFRISTDYVYAVFKCEYCDLSFISTDNLKLHLAQHVGDLPYMCLVCNLHFESYYKVMEHKKDHQLNKITSDKLFSIPVHYLCEFCGKSFRQWEYLYIHRYKSHLNGRNQCSDESSKRQHTAPPFTHQLRQNHLCDICNKTFESQALLSKHRKQEHPQISKYQCTECGKVLANLTGLVIHRRLHTGEKPFVCDVCGKSFHQSSGMYTHRRIHTRECPYRCEYCGQAYNVKGDLDNHRRAKHTKERPFKCETCQKSFLTSSVFYQHRILHTGVRKYKCMHCDKSFARWNALRLHIRTHTGEKPYVCHVCQRGFAQKGDMKKHMKTQHNILEMPQVV